MYKQIPLFSDKNHQEDTPGSKLEPPRALQIRGLIKRQLREYRTTEQPNWIQRTTQLKFKRLEVDQYGDL